MAAIEAVNPLAIKAKGAKARPKAVGVTKDFNAFLGAVDAFGPAGVTAGQVYGNVNSATVLSAAFSGVSSLGAQTGGSYYPTFAGGSALAQYGAGVAKYGYGGYGGYASYGSAGLPGGGTSVVPGVEGFTQADLINTMNQNNLQLLELQATMQSNMQSWNTKSNILSADHRARMAMIEKFQARG